MSLVHRVADAMRYMPDVDKTWDEILGVMVEVTHGENCSLMVKSPQADELVIRAAKGKWDVELGKKERAFRQRFDLDGGIAAWVMKTGRGAYVSDVDKDSRFVEIEESPFKIGSMMCFPVRDGDQIVGIINCSHGEKAFFGELEETAMKIVSNQVGVVLTSARMGQKDLGADEGVFHEDRSSRELDPSEWTGQHLVIPWQSGHRDEEKVFFLYESEKMARVIEVIDQVADTDVTVLIEGESGVGKELVARALHCRSARKNMPFMKVNCAALPEELLESELFGYEKGAFTGAYRRKPGKFELAHRGTIFLDEIAEISPSLQAKLLQVLQDGEFARLGGKLDIRVDVRVLVATNKDLAEYAKMGRFRTDLFYRLNVVNLHIPPLRERMEELPLLTRHLLDKYSRKYMKSVPALSPETTDLLLSYEWPGNIRELENMIKRLVVLGDEKVVRRELNPHSFARPEPLRLGVDEAPKAKSLSLKEISRKAALQAEGEVIQKTLAQTRWNRKKAAKILGISYKALLYKIKECGLDQTPGVEPGN